MTNNHNGRGTFRQNILRSNIFLSYINNTPITQPQRKPKIQNSLKVISVNNNRRTKWSVPYG